MQKSRGCAGRRSRGAHVPQRTVTVALQRSPHLSMPMFSTWEKEMTVLWTQCTLLGVCVKGGANLLKPRPGFRHTAAPPWQSEDPV